MSKKIFFIICLTITSASLFAADIITFGIGLKAGGGQTKSGLQDALDSLGYSDESSTVMPSYILGGVDLFFESRKLFLLPRGNFFGIRFGFAKRGDEKAAAAGQTASFGPNGVRELEYKTTHTEFPFALYYKRTLTDNWKISGGAGAAYGWIENSQTDKFTANTAAPPYSPDPSNPNNFNRHRKEKVTKIYPFLTAGVELMFFQGLSLGIDLRYNFLAEFKKGGIVYRDINGIEAALGLRCYF
ncbi:MAG: outer membrane beta-barrel protein [Spirochaetales bacterium]|jgi:hypothetical protein|nr:outer membrane beta-barrel protein [Spirochaetales bacterium]